MNNDKSYFKVIEINDKFYPIVRRKKGETKIEECPYCEQEHTHSIGGGHRQPHCTDRIGRFNEIIINDILIPASRGYVIEEE
jgi:hypothetical protein